MEQVRQSFFFNHAIKDNSFMESFDSYSSKFPEDIRQLNFYIDNTFLDPYSRVFLLIRIYEQFIQKHKELLSEKDKHIKSVFYEILKIGNFGFRYKIKSEKDLIVLLNISIPLFINYQLRSIVQRKELSKLLYGTIQPPNNQCFLINDFELLCLSHFILTSPQLETILINDITNINKELSEHEYKEKVTDSSILLIKLEASEREASIRTNIDVFCIYYMDYYMGRFMSSSMDSCWDTDWNSDWGNYDAEYEDKFHDKELTYDNSYEQQIPELFQTYFLNRGKIDELDHRFVIDIPKIIGTRSEEKQKNVFLESEIFKKSIQSKITIHSTFKLADKIFKKYFELNLPNNRYKVIYPNFRYFLKELFNNDIINKDLKKVELDELEVRNLIGFFSEYKSTNTATNLFTYEVINLITFLEHITGLEAKISTWDKAHRDKKSKPNKDCKREINTILDQYPRDKKW
ncbi:hypothetical protein OA93_23340 [Flavobacterium sp. KMS]|uniref:hypothetical protein n=1 Tax=Flavobacterium sp. KMS TaxID=1566023 RepID=UPI00057F0FB1|nr:hypothetical protein [Flavobacterium sp. KMS]KIA92474.1 hypothetical protein OA93_23340 [Flavobacterium sp. KMS]